MPFKLISKKKLVEFLNTTYGCSVTENTFSYETYGSSTFAYISGLTEKVGANRPTIAKALNKAGYKAPKGEWGYDKNEDADFPVSYFKSFGWDQ